MEHSAPVAVMFQMQANVGADAPLQVVTNVCGDVDSIANGAFELASHIAVGEADDYLADLVRERGPSALLELARRRELPEATDADAQDLERLWLELQEFGYLRYPRSGLAMLLLDPRLRFQPWTRLVNQIRAIEVSLRIPTEPYRLHSLRYENPFVAEVLAATGAAALGLTALAAMIRDWRARRRRENARADAEERIQRAVASDMEDQVWARSQMRRILLDRVARDNLPVSPDAIDSILSNGLVQAADRLAERDFEMQRIERDRQ